MPGLADPGPNQRDEGPLKQRGWCLAPVAGIPAIGAWHRLRIRHPDIGKQGRGLRGRCQAPAAGVPATGARHRPRDQLRGRASSVRSTSRRISLRQCLTNKGSVTPWRDLG